MVDGMCFCSNTISSHTLTFSFVANVTEVNLSKPGKYSGYYIWYVPDTEYSHQKVNQIQIKVLDVDYRDISNDRHSCRLVEENGSDIVMTEPTMKASEIDSYDDTFKIPATNENIYCDQMRLAHMPTIIKLRKFPELRKQQVHLRFVKELDDGRKVPVELTNRLFPAANMEDMVDFLILDSEGENDVAGTKYTFKQVNLLFTLTEFEHEKRETEEVATSTGGFGLAKLKARQNNNGA